MFIDEVSEDVLKLEVYFLAWAPRVPIQIEFHDSGLLPDSGNTLDGYAGPVHQVVEFVGWEPMGDSWHLTYRKTRRTGVQSGTYSTTYNGADDLEHVPLSDAAVEDRQRAHRALPELLREAGAIARS